MKGLLKHKKLLIGSGIVLGLVLLVVILCFTLFSLRTVEVEFKNNPQIFTEQSKISIKENQSIKYGTPVFALNKNKIITELEKDKPYLQVINIETVFPNKIIIHCAEREETFAVKAGDKKYFICDRDFKVLTIRTNYSSTQDNAILFLGLENIIENTNRVNEGEFLEFSSETEMLKNIGQALLQNNKTVAEQRALIKTIELDSCVYYYTAKNQPYLKITDFNGFVSNIYVPETLLATKFQAMFASVSQVIYNPEKFFTEEEIASMGTIDENYYLNYELQIEEDTKGKLYIRLEPIKKT